MAEHKHCPTCTTSNAVSAVLCTNCGASIIGVDITEVPTTLTPVGPVTKTSEVPCPECRAANPASAVRCRYCDALLVGSESQGRDMQIVWPWGEQVISGALRVGREPPAPQALIDELKIRGLDNVSRQHAELRVEDGRATVTDLGSSNGTFLDGTRLMPHVAQIVPERATLRFGATLVISVRIVTKSAP